MAKGGEICQMDTTTLARRIAAKELSPVEVVDAVLDRLDRLDPTLYMFTTVVPDQAREQAKQVEVEIAAGGAAKPLVGVPTGVKDLISTKGIRTASGSFAYADFVPDEDDVVAETCVRALVENTSRRREGSGLPAWRYVAFSGERVRLLGGSVRVFGSDEAGIRGSGLDLLAGAL